MELIALLSSGKGSWGQVAGLINRGEWDKIILVGSEFASKFNVQDEDDRKKTEFIKVDLNNRLTDMKDEFMKKLKGKIKGTEIALTIASGTGKEHMALISALLSMPVGVRFTALTKKGIIFM